MSKLNRWKSGSALLLALSLTAGTVTPIVAPLVAPTPAFAQSKSFSDVPSGYWAEEFIDQLATRGIIAGFQDGTFRPEAPVTRAQFAAMIRKAFNKPQLRTAIKFRDVPSNYWAREAIQEAYQTGFLAGYSDNRFRPDTNIPREQVLVSLANGLNYSASGSTTTILNYYSDANEISGYAGNSIAAATEKGLVVNYPSATSLNPTRNATRAEVAAFIYQALVREGQAQALASPYIVSLTNTPPPTPTPTSFRIPSGTSIPLNYNKERILVTANETAPVTLNVGANITTSSGTILIPAGSQVIGELRPAEGGTRFVAQTLTLPNGRQVAINGTSQVVTKTEQIRKGASVGTLIKDAVLGSAAAAAVAGVTGDRTITAGEVLGGTAAGGLLGLFLGRDRVDLIVVDPHTDLNVTLDQDLVINTR